MSVQTDCEMLSVQAMEAYARKYHVSGNDVVELFHRNQVFEGLGDHFKFIQLDRNYFTESLCQCTLNVYWLCNYIYKCDIHHGKRQTFSL